MKNPVSELLTHLGRRRSDWLRVEDLVAAQATPATAAGVAACPVEELRVLLTRWDLDDETLSAAVRRVHARHQDDPETVARLVQAVIATCDTVGAVLNGDWFLEAQARLPVELLADLFAVLVDAAATATSGPDSPVLQVTGTLISCEHLVDGLVERAQAAGGPAAVKTTALWYTYANRMFAAGDWYPDDDVVLGEITGHEVRSRQLADAVINTRTRVDNFQLDLFDEDAQVALDVPEQAAVSAATVMFQAARTFGFVHDEEGYYADSLGTEVMEILLHERLLGCLEFPVPSGLSRVCALAVDDGSPAIAAVVWTWVDRLLPGGRAPRLFCDRDEAGAALLPSSCPQRQHVVVKSLLSDEHAARQIALTLAVTPLATETALLLPPSAINNTIHPATAEALVDACSTALADDIHARMFRELAVHKPDLAVAELLEICQAAL